ncbi:hypothetical protein Q8W17_23090 [Photobacterium damselae subsp. piscicida]|nr:hypothetical protein [Photobacterium damselae subsp. piscicida]
MNHNNRIEDLELRISLAYQEGHFQQAKELEAQLSRIRGQRNQYDRNEPYSLEGRSYWDE